MVTSTLETPSILHSLVNKLYLMFLFQQSLDEDPNRLSVVFDEVIVKERILVEGGSSQQILSQFDGPVTFNGEVRFNAQLVVNNKLRVTDTVDFRSTNDALM